MLHISENGYGRIEVGQDSWFATPKQLKHMKLVREAIQKQGSCGMTRLCQQVAGLSGNQKEAVRTAVLLLWKLGEISIKSNNGCKIIRWKGAYTKRMAERQKRG